MTTTILSLGEAVELSRTGDLWLFRGHSPADQAIRALTNSPVNHVGMTIALDDLPPLLWHAELGRSLPDLWTGTHHRGVQLHDLNAAVTVWDTRYNQRAWLRQLDQPVTKEMEDELLRVIARLGAPRSPPWCRWLDDGPAVGSVGRHRWKRPIAPRSSPRPIRRWASSTQTGLRTGMTPVASGAATDSSCWAGQRSVPSSASRSSRTGGRTHPIEPHGSHDSAG